MIYPTLNEKGTKKYIINALNGGLSLASDSDRIPNNSLSECVNMWYSRGRLKTRPGISPCGEPLEFISSYETVKDGLNITDTVYYKNGKRHNIAYFISEDGFSFVKLYFYLIDSSGQGTAIGEMIFNRISSDSFYVPQNIFFAVGNPTLGSGIYAFITRKSGQNEQYNIYEASSDLKEWLDCRDNYYVPVLYINGLGTRYSEARELYTLSYPTPQFPEQRNMLTGWFKAYFTSDGVSSVFNMPISNIDSGTAVICRIYSDSKSYTEWIVPINSDYNTKSFAGVDITLRCDRKAGVISFFHGDTPYGIPILPYCSSNNIVIRACKQTPFGLEKVVSSKKSVIHNSRLFVGSNTKSPNEIYSARLSNPLYFPINAKAIAGDSTSEITALGVGSNKLIVFKGGECYHINMNSGKTNNKIVLIDSTEDIGATDMLESVVISRDIGCDCPDTVAQCGNRLVWADSSGQVYMLANTTYGKENNIYKLSLPLKNAISDLGADVLKKAFAVVHCGYYMLFAGDSIYLMYHRVKSFGYSAQYSDNANPQEMIAWYYWKLPAGITAYSGVTVGEECILGAVDDNSLWCYCAKLNGGADSVITGDRYGWTQSVTDIVASFATAAFHFDAPESTKRVERVAISADLPHGAKITFYDGKLDTSRMLLSIKNGVVEQFGIKPSRTLKISLKGTGGMSVSSISFKYRVIL